MGLLVTDRTLVELIERRLERDIAADETVTDALEIGARVLDREATGAEVEAVRHEFEHASAEVERSFADRARSIEEGLEKQFERFLGEDGGAMSKLLDAHADEFAELVTQHFGARPQHRRAAPGEGAGGEVAERLPPGPAAPVLRPGRAQPAGRLQGRGRARGEALGRRAASG